MSEPELRSAGVIGPVAERLSVPEGYEKAVEAALGERLGFVLVRNRAAAATALEFLSGRDLGRCGFIALDALGAGAEGDLTRALLGEYQLAESLAQARDLEPGRALLTRNGEYQGPGGVIVGGHDQKEDQGLLARLKDIEILEAETEGLAEEKDRLEEQIRGVKARMEEMRAMLTRSENAVREAEAALVETDKQMSGLSIRREEAQRRAAAVARSLESLEAEAQQLEEQKGSILAERESLESDEFDLAQELQKTEESVTAAVAELEAARERETQASLEERARAERVSTAERETSRTREWLRDQESQRAKLQEDLNQAEAELVRLRERRELVAESLEGSHEALAEAREEVATQKRLVDELRSALNAKENEARAGRRQRSEVDEEVRKLELDLQENNFRRQSLLERIENDYKLDLANLPEEEKPKPIEDFDPAASRERRDELRSKIEGMGEVNLTAIGEHEALQERYDFYKAQVDDLNASIENLRNSISRINRTCKIRFSSTFKAVDEKLREIFPLLFEGGEAWLSLTDENDPLESGVEIHVHPPGKKLTVMSLLSGGEKALVALALIFALYLIKPSPFCLLDEVDAPLDEANIDRFNRSASGNQAGPVVADHHGHPQQEDHADF